MKKQVLAIALVTMMMVSLLTGCGGKSPQTNTTAISDAASNASQAQTDDPITFTMMYRDSPAYPFNPQWPALKEMQKVSNVTLDIRTVPSKDYMSKARIILSSGDIPDIVSGVDKEVIAEYASSGVLLRISDYLDLMPNLSAKIEAYGISDELDNWRTKDGGLYMLPFMNEAPMYNVAPAVRMDILEEYGLEVPTTYDELYEVLKAIKAKRPDTYPMANYNGANNIRMIAGPSWGIEGSYNGFLYNEKTNEFFYANTTDQYKEYLKYFNKLIEEKLADPEIYTGTLDQWKQKTVSNNSVFCFTWISELGQVNTDGKSVNGEAFNMSAIPPLEGPGGKKSAAMGRIYHGTVLPASVAEKPYFERLMKYLDWMCYSDEGSQYTTWGIEGLTFEKKDGKNVFADSVLQSGSIQKALWDVGASNNNFTLVYPYDWFVQVLNVPEVKTLTEEAEKGDWFPAVAKAPKLEFEQREQEKMILATLNDYINQMQEQFIYGKIDIDSGWEDFVKEVNAKGADKLLAIYNAE